MKTFKLHLIRHGMTAGNLQGLYIGSGTDIPLCDEGRAQLKELKERLRQRTFCSPMQATSSQCTTCGKRALACLRTAP